MAGVIHKFHYLKLGLSVVLVFVGVKMLLVDVYKIPIGISLGAIALILALSVAASLMFPKIAQAHSPVEHDALKLIPDPTIVPVKPTQALPDRTRVKRNGRKAEIDVFYHPPLVRPGHLNRKQ